MTSTDPLHDRIVEAVDARRTQIIDLVVDLVRIPSETQPPRGDEGPVQRRIEQVLTDLGLDVDVFEPWSVPGATEHPGWWPGLEYDDRPNVVATWTGTGQGSSLILNGHADVVPAGPREHWTRDPYGAEIADGLIHGRGTADQKAGIAAMIQAVAALKDLGLTPKGDVIVQSVVNEEFGGYNGTLACCVKGYAADAAIITEPTGLHVAPAAKGGQTYRARVPGVNAHHGMAWEGVSAFDKAIIIRDALVAWEDLRADELSDVPLFSDTSKYPKPALANTIWHVEAGEPFLMATPASAEMSFWVDVLPGEDREQVLRRFEGHVQEFARRDAFLSEHPPTLERAHMRPFTGVAIDLDHPIVDSLRRSHEAANPGPSELAAMMGACDQMIFNLYTDTPAVVYGPGDIRVAHSPNEFVPVDEVIAAARTLAVTIADFCGIDDD